MHLSNKINKEKKEKSEPSLVRVRFTTSHFIDFGSSLLSLLLINQSILCESFVPFKSPPLAITTERGLSTSPLTGGDGTIIKTGK